ncbi:membrane protein [Streptomyces rameus]|uniref:Membrane protein n=1 Tax=Streptomyces rameus TaxID=68261 RepID=A0ABN3V420_9ACTN
MHMNSVPQHLQSEDRQEFERLLDEALRSAPHRPELAAVGRRLNPEQLRTMALNASALITAAAAAEYQRYLEIRDRLRQPALSAPPTAAGSAADGAASADTGLVTALGEAAESSGAGAIAVIAVLAPLLSGTAAVVFLLVGYILKMLDPGHSLAGTLLSTGWVFGAMTAAAILVAAVGLLLTALRNSTTADAQARDTANEELARAREAWRDALLERGILPFLREALAEPGPAAVRHPAPPAPTGRIPRLGYDRPGFSSPDDGTASDRPSFTSPDYTSPDFGGPEHRPE